MHTLGQKFDLYFYTIPTLCACGCGEVVWRRGSKYKNWHSSKILVHHTEEQKQKWSQMRKGSIPWNKGIHTGIKTRGNTGMRPSAESNLKRSAALKNRRKSEQHRAKHRGKNNSSWRGGISFLPYCFRFNKSLKSAVKERDNHTCQLCGATDKKLAVHHIHYDKENCYPDLITLCQSDNAKVNFNREYHENLFMNKLNDREFLCWTLSLYKEKTV